MAVVEIHIKDDKVYKIEGHDAYVYVHDHDTKEIITMVFNKQEEIYEDWKSANPFRVSNIKTNISKGERKNNL